MVPEFQKRFRTSWDKLAGVESSISFLKREILKTEKGLALILERMQKRLSRPTRKILEESELRQFPAISHQCRQT